MQPRILVIDDDASLRRLSERTLSDAGFDVRLAGDGEAGMEMVLAERFDAVITDIMMPGKEGIETIRELRRERPQITIVAMSGGGSHHRMEFLDYARHFGAAEVIAKPFTPDDLVAAVQRALGQR